MGWKLKYDEISLVLIPPSLYHELILDVFIENGKTRYFHYTFQNLVSVIYFINVLVGSKKGNIY